LEENEHFRTEKSKMNIEKDLTFVVAFGIEDDLRLDVNESIKNLTNARINVRMISGDNIWTAKR